MATPVELAQERTGLDEAQRVHVQRILATWAVLADLSFSDLVLLAPIAPDRSVVVPAPDGSPLVPAAAPSPSLFSEPAPPTAPHSDPSFVMLGQVRPNNTPTVIPEDLVGQTLLSSDWPVIIDAFKTGCTMTGSVELQPGEEPVRLRGIPVGHEGKVIAVVAQLSAVDTARRSGRLERVYEDLFDRLCTMVTEGRFPFSGEDLATEEAPRVGDGVIVVDREGRVVYTSPNASNALHRMGVYSQVEGRRLGDLGVEETAVTWALTLARPVVEEVERRPDVVVLLQCTPLLSGDEITGVMILLRDVTDLRRLDRLLLSKDAAIREVHHRVKNNLQTISSLLRLQARRLDPGEGQVALREAERRVRSIAMVHEVLSREPGEQVSFDEIVTSLVQMAQDSVVSTRPVEFEVDGSVGDVPADVATSLAVVLAEILQNAVEHAFGEGADAQDPAAGGEEHVPTGHITLRMGEDRGVLSVEVEDDGCGIPEGFDIERTESLGLSIVRDLVTSQLGGTIAMRLVEPSADGRSGTVVELTIPVETASRSAS